MSIAADIYKLFGYSNVKNIEMTSVKQIQKLLKIYYPDDKDKFTEENTQTAVASSLPKEFLTRDGKYNSDQRWLFIQIDKPRHLTLIKDYIIQKERMTVESAKHKKPSVSSTSEKPSVSSTSEKPLKKRKKGGNITVKRKINKTIRKK